jgi:hypothetical protein
MMALILVVYPIEILKRIWDADSYSTNEDLAKLFNRSSSITRL